MFHIQTI